MDDKYYMHWLCDAPGIGYAKTKRLLENFESAKALFEINPCELENFELFGLSAKDVYTLTDKRYKEESLKEYEAFEKAGIKITTIFDKDYPEKLLRIYNPPFILYYRGSLPDKNKKTVAIVGSRNCSEYGRHMAMEIAYELSSAGIQVISGFARGIDTAAHNGCIKGATPTYAVFGCGINTIYPVENTFMCEELLQKGGGVLSEFSPDTAVKAGLFPLRNRIISGMADLVIVIEAGKRSGSLITVEHALEQNKTVMALPGRVSDAMSQGCNNLIRQGAAIITSTEDVFFELGIDISHKYDKDKKSEINLASTEKMLYSYLDFNGQSVEDLSKRLEMDEQELKLALVKLELAGIVKEISSGFYVKI